MPPWALVITALAAGRVSVVLTLYVAGLTVPNGRPLAPLAMYAALSATFTVAGLALVLARDRDPRAGWLGVFLALIGCPLVRPLVAGESGPLLAWLVHLRPEALTPACAWAFAASFPVPLAGRPHRFIAGIVAASAVAGYVVLGICLFAAGGPPALHWLGQAVGVAAADRVSPIWLFIFAMSLPALTVLLWRAVAASDETRPGARLFIRALLVGLGPFTAVVLLEGVSSAVADAIHHTRLEPWVTGALFAALGTLPFSTGYAVMFDRVVETRLVLQAAAQYLLARYVLGLITVVPFAALVLFLVEHRHESLALLVSGGERPLVLLTATLAGLAASRSRVSLLRALDRRYFGEPYETDQVIARLASGRPAANIAELALRAESEIGRCLHAPVDLFLLDRTQGVFVAPTPGLAPLPNISPLVRMGDSDPDTVELASPRGQVLLASLTREEQQWLAGSRVALLAPIHSPVFGLVGLVTVGPKHGGLAFDADDRRVLSVIGATVGLTFDRLALQQGGGERLPETAALECHGCGAVHTSSVSRCRCGRGLAPAPVPYVLRGVFRFERRIGTGGAGTVYRAIDLGLGRPVAVKVLADAGDLQVDALIREARSMAGLSHRHLAVIHGVERWGARTLLVQEYLDAGTLAQRLRGGGLDPGEVVRIGDALADALMHVHQRGVVHCDVKPSNIGFTADGLVKLFDFSLARRVIGAPEAVRVTTASPPVDPLVLDSASRQGGTAFYMSPETVRGARPSPEADWWALAVVLFEALTGRRPFDGPDSAAVFSAILFRPSPSPRQFRQDLPDAAVQFFTRALAATPGDRFGDGQAFRAGLRRLSSVHTH